jgi:hypothetical protein
MVEHKLRQVTAHVTRLGSNGRHLSVHGWPLVVAITLLILDHIQRAVSQAL